MDRVTGNGVNIELFITSASSLTYMWMNHVKPYENMIQPQTYLFIYMANHFPIFTLSVVINTGKYLKRIWINTPAALYDTASTKNEHTHPTYFTCYPFNLTHSEKIIYVLVVPSITIRCYFLFLFYLHTTSDPSWCLSLWIDGWECDWSEINGWIEAGWWIFLFLKLTHGVLLAASNISDWRKDVLD